MLSEGHWCQNSPNFACYPNLWQKLLQTAIGSQDSHKNRKNAKEYGNFQLSRDCKILQNWDKRLIIFPGVADIKLDKVCKCNFRIGCTWIIKKAKKLGKCSKMAHFLTFNPIPTELWNDIAIWGGPIWPRAESRLLKVIQRHLSTSNLISSKYFGL